MPRFVLLFHECPPNFGRPSHWDLMLEAGDVLRTWALEKLPRDWRPLVDDQLGQPAIAATNTVPAQPLGDHRPAYLDYEGPLSGQRGSVTRVEAGTFLPREETPERWEVELSGRCLAGRMTLTQLQEAESAWQLTWQSDVVGS